MYMYRLFFVLLSTTKLNIFKQIWFVSIKTTFDRNNLWSNWLAFCSTEWPNSIKHAWINKMLYKLCLIKGLMSFKVCQTCHDQTHLKLKVKNKLKMHQHTCNRLKFYQTQSNMIKQGFQTGKCFVKQYWIVFDCPAFPIWTGLNTLFSCFDKGGKGSPVTSVHTS